MFQVRIARYHSGVDRVFEITHDHLSDTGHVLMNIEIFDHRGRFQYNLAQIGRLDVGDVVNVGVIHSQVLQTLEGDVLD